ncbi:FAD-dependent oxidoreductase [Arthrobacter sp. B2a2-09]|uniref:FAD-dependent oxidoreductase n=1 Tax=Arthrobacter sp. B2a2-09 TaxID=2952822 RepID=UPI0022CD40B0|nr:FAD-dependent oxidoreductase [Arthrobacter sp. B2a2-09]MCZ9881784.1 FAD-dependent oxidoreductase [Arthrobacter sp. B2a2-09]
MNAIKDLPSQSPTIAIVGSGPSGCYLAQYLRKRWKEAEIVIFDRLPVPYGLVRFGVAPDHLGTKAVARQFDRLFEREGVRFIGETEIGNRVTLQELRDAFDIVVLASGLHGDRALGVPGDTLPGVHGAGRITRLINGHPGEQIDGLRIGERIAIVGNGNVAMDLVRLLLTSPERLLELGVAEDVVRALEPGSVKRIDVVGRSAAHDAKFDLAMLRELTKLPDVSFVAQNLADEGIADADGIAKRDAVAEIAGGSPARAARSVHFHFGWTPERIIGQDKVQSIAFRSTADENSTLLLDVEGVLTAIGFEELTTSPIRRSHHESAESELDKGYLSPGLYCAGWLRRGPRGTIPQNRVDSKMVADAIIEAVDTAQLVPGKPGLPALLAQNPSNSRHTEESA